MYNLFNLAAQANMPIHVPGGWRLAKDTLRAKVSKIINYHRHNPTAVPSNHLLVRLLQTIGVPRSQDIYRYVDNVDSAANKYGMALKLTSSINRGQVFDGVFYGPEVKEIIVSHTQPFDPAWAEANWINLCPVQVIHHPISNLSFMLPNGKKNNSETGLAVIAINLPLLAVMYRSFRIEESNYANLSGDSERSIMNFVSMFVLPNMLFSHADYALFNRAYNLTVGAPMGEAYGKHSFYVVNNDKEVDKVLGTLVDLTRKSNRGMTSILRSFPALYRPNFDKVLEVPDMAMTYQVYWAMVLSRMNGVDFMIEMSRLGIRTTNGGDVNKLMQLITRMRRDNVLKNTLTDDLYYDAMFKIDNIVEKITA